MGNEEWGMRNEKLGVENCKFEGGCVIEIFFVTLRCENVERFDCLQPQKKMLKWSMSVRYICAIYFLLFFRSQIP